MSRLFSKPSFLLDFHLDRESVHVVARAVGDAVAGHPLVADDRVLQRLVPRRAEVHLAGGVRRPVHEEEGRVVGVRLLRRIVGVALVPVLVDRRLDVRGRVLVVDIVHIRWSSRAYLNTAESASPGHIDAA